jgi:hypothetical protein
MTTSSAPAVNALRPVSVIVFPGGFNWPIWVAQDKGYFATGGIEVLLTPTPNSVFQLTNLIDGKFDIAMTAIDNVIAYMEGQGEAPTVSSPDLIVFMGGDNGFLSFVGGPEIKNITDLKGKTVSSMHSRLGTFVLLDLLKRAGLNQEDYKIEKAGGVLARWEALKDRKHDATMLITPFDIFARKAGLNVLQYAISVYGHYQGLCGATRRKWAASNPRLVEAARAVFGAVAWHGTRGLVLRPDHAGLVHRLGGCRAVADFAQPDRAAGFRSALRHGFPDPSRHRRVFDARRRVPGRDGIGSTLRRPWPFRAWPDPDGLAVRGAAGVDDQLSRPGRAGAGRSGRHRKSLLSPVSALGIDPDGFAGNGGDRDREPGRHHRRIFGDPAGDSARAATAA